MSNAARLRLFLRVAPLAVLAMSAFSTSLQGCAGGAADNGTEEEVEGRQDGGYDSGYGYGGGYYGGGKY